jgi:catechol 2,3-dioxygenase-like lactoylglutathione lyase family enzyme
MMRPSRNLGLHHVALRVPDMVSAKQFYVNLLGFSVERVDEDDTTFLTTGTDSLTLALTDPKTRQTIDHIGFAVPSVEDVHNWEGYLRENGVTVKRSTCVFRDGSCGCSVLDPGGNEVQVLYHPIIVKGLLSSS